MNDLPFVRKGQPITEALWNQLCAAVRACRLIAGEGVRLREMPDGTVIHFHGSGADFSHPFQVSLLGNEGARVRPGTVNRVDACIKGVPLAGEDGQSPPVLKWSRPKLDSEGRGYVCVEVTCREADWSVEKVEVVQVADPNTDDGSPGDALSGSAAGVALSGGRTRYPLAMLRERDDSRLDLHQITFFDLQHRAALGNDRQTATRHFFWQ